MFIQEMHYEFKLRSNRLNSNNFKDPLPIIIDRYLNRAQNWYVEHFAEKRFPDGFDFSQQRKDMFSTITVTFPDQPRLSATKVEDNLYRLPVSTLKYQYAHWIRGSVKCSSKPVNISMVKHDTLNKYLRDDHTKPSAQWGEILAKIGSFGKEQNIFFYTDGDLTDNTLEIDYIRYPSNVFVSGYNTIAYEYATINKVDQNSFYGQNSDPVHSELPAMFHSLLVDIAVYLYAGSTDNPFLTQFLQNNIITQA